MNRALFSTALLTTALLASCAEENKLSDAGLSIARLSVVNMGALAAVLAQDERCGFASEVALATAQVRGTPGGEGSVRYTISGCTLDFDQQATALTDCNGNATTLRGQVTVTGTLTLAGTVTGSQMQPILPSAADALTIDLSQVEVSGFAVESAAGGLLTVREGSLAARVKPALGKSASLGVCTIPTANLTVEDLGIFNATLLVSGGGQSSHVFVPSASITAHVGVAGGKENTISGSVTLFTEPVVFESQPLDPTYDATSFSAGYACTDDLASPPSFDCGGGVTGEEEIAHGAARLTIQSVSAIAGLLNADTTCGLASPNVLAAALTRGAIGATGSVELTVQDCLLDATNAKVVSTDCAGNDLVAHGRVTVSAVQTLRGRLTGDAAQPVLPLTDLPSTLVLTSVRFDDFRVENQATASATASATLTQVSGTLTASITPRLAASASRNVCSVVTPIAKLDGVRYTDATVALTQDGQSLSLRIADSNLSAVNGALGNDTNVIDGRITVSGTSYRLDDEPLNPDYDQAAFDMSWQCAGDLRTPVSFMCDPLTPVADGVARLTPQLLGALVPLLEANSDCGFASASVRQQAMVSGALGTEGSGTLTVSGCRLSFAQPTFVQSDCSGAVTLVQGSVTVSGTRRVRGFVTGDPTNPILPTSRDGVRYSLQATLDGLQVTSSAGGPLLIGRSGMLSGTIQPRAALDITTGACTIPTPVLAFTDLAYSGAQLELQAEGATFTVSVPTSSLDATNGARDGVVNALGGTIDIEGQSYTVPSDAAGSNPAYDQARFDASFACTRDQQIPTDDAQCGFRGVLAPAAARLMVRALSTAAGAVSADQQCGLMSPSVLSTPLAVNGMTGQPGSVTHGLRRCQPQLPPANVPLATDCLGARSFAHGAVTVTATNTTSGLRIEQCVGGGGGPPCFQLAAPLCQGGGVNLGLTAEFAGLEVFDVDRGAQAPSLKLTVHSGTGSTTLVPRLGESASNRGVCSVNTPVAALNNITIRNAPVTLELEGRTFRVTIQSASLSAASGRASGAGNTISGSITIDGATFPVGGPLLPNYDQTLFDLAYACTPDLLATITP